MVLGLEVSLMFLALLLLDYRLYTWFVLPLLGMSASESRVGLSLLVCVSRTCGFRTFSV